MTFSSPGTATPADAPETRRYNRIRRRLEIVDFLTGLLLMVVLLLTGWTGILRDWSYVGARQNYVLALFLYVLMLLLLSKILGIGLDFYGFRLEHRFNLSNQKFKSWVWDEIKGWLVGLVIAIIIVELVYYTIRQSPQYWWLIAWGAFIFLFVAFAQIAPRQAKVVELRYFGGLNEEEIVEVLKISPRTVRRDWEFARVWLARELHA